MSLLRIRAGYFLSGIGFGAGIALLQLRADLAASTELLSTQVRRERERESGKESFFFTLRERRFFFSIVDAPLPLAAFLLFCCSTALGPAPRSRSVYLSCSAGGTRTSSRRSRIGASSDSDCRERLFSSFRSLPAADGQANKERASEREREGAIAWGWFFLSPPRCAPPRSALAASRSAPTPQRLAKRGLPQLGAGREVKRGLHPLAPGALFSSASLLLLRRCLCQRSLFRCRRSPSPPAALSSSSSALSFSLSLVRTAPLRGRRATSLSREKQRELWRRETERERARGWGKRISGEKEGALEKNNRSATDRALTPSSFPRPPPKKRKTKQRTGRSLRQVAQRARHRARASSRSPQHQHFQPLFLVR